MSCKFRALSRSPDPFRAATELGLALEIVGSRLFGTTTDPWGSEVAHATALTQKRALPFGFQRNPEAPLEPRQRSRTSLGYNHIADCLVWREVRVLNRFGFQRMWSQRWAHEELGR
jgi:hypothetical protein